jgi:L-iditol 2-dehydrogenase
MLRAELIRPGVLEMREVPVPSPGPGELLVRIEVALTCGTDLKTYRRGHPKIPLPAPFGHEFAGTVAATGEGVTAFRAGDAIVAVPTAPCGECRLCSRGRENLCPAAVGRIVLGAFAEYLLLPAHLVAQGHVLHRPAHLSAEHAAALEPLACVVHGARRVSLAAAETVVILGDGPIALLFVQLALAAGARVLLAGRHEIRLAAARSFGAETVVSRNANPRELVLDHIRGGADLVIESVGDPALWETAHALASPAGEVLLYGGCAAGTRASFDTARLHYDEIDLKGAFHYTHAAVREAFDLLASGTVAVAPLITHRRPLAALEQALALVVTREAIKVAVLP